MDNRVAILIPFYKENLTGMERLSLRRTNNILKDYSIFFIAPEGLNISEGKRIIADAKECRMDSAFFDGFSGYNRLMLSKELYERFIDFEYVLICQQDVFVIEDRLKEYLDLPYDYIGSPIPHMGPWSPELYVGNGGFSLRRVKAVLNLLETHGDDLDALNDNEDIFYSAAGEKYPEDFRTASVTDGLGFAFNMYYKTQFEMNGNRLPMAIHGIGSGDGAFLNKHLTPYLEVGERIENDCNWEEEIGEFQSFVRRAEVLVLYGAGDAGAIFTELCKRMGCNVDCFLVSDGQIIPEKTPFDIPAFNVSSYPKDISKASVLITISSRYKRLPDFEKIMRDHGAKNVMQMSNELFHAGINELIKK